MFVGRLAKEGLSHQSIKVYLSGIRKMHELPFPNSSNTYKKQSKTDLFWKVVNLFLAKTGKELCPVAAMLPYLALRGSTQGPLFISQNGSYLTRQKFTDLLRQALRDAGLDDSKYAAQL